MSGSDVVFVGEAMTAVVHGVCVVSEILGCRPVIVGGLAVLSRLSHPYRATVDLDVVDRRLGAIPHLEVLRGSAGAVSVEPAAVLVPTVRGPVKVDVLEIRQVELDHPSDDPGDRLHASAHAWANDTATELTITAIPSPNDTPVHVTSLVAEPGPLIAMKLQAIMNRSESKQGTDLLDIVQLTLDDATRHIALDQIAHVEHAVAQDISVHIDLWLEQRRDKALRWIHAVGGQEITTDDLELVAEMLVHASQR
ncbi:MAG: nucleotidyl transferase AbiEii/AbiGii toxin family protein [Rhodococcus sp. (in: high G+C Gram-positive bacteria)]|uniref:nucleotidyl transferase AbiEii/AbiGii toxin family protein n=1 Tax=Rhodococcus sp. TaxID=1831 RepID=UPI002AD86F97|nr:nucleotidyl transferase AbiEii/AbiGii toxin family protein [Rhodococcus sp. (in: high G+C Gram-positive bacteria)]